MSFEMRSSRSQTRAYFIYCHFIRGTLLRKTSTHRTIYLQCIERMKKLSCTSSKGVRESN
jgi:hypothetical protein